MNTTNHTLILQTGMFAIQVECESSTLFLQLQQRYDGFLAPNLGHGNSFKIKVRPPQPLTPPIKNKNKTPIFSPKGLCFSTPGWEGNLDISRWAGWVSPGARAVEEVDYFLRVVCAVQVFQAGGFLFHAAGILRDGRAFVFFGPSGIGKTTISRMSGEGAVLNDDLILLLPVEEHWYVYSTPFSNAPQVAPLAGQYAPLAGMYRLVQDQQVFLETPTPGHILAELIANIPVLSTDSTYSPQLLARCQRLLASTPVFRLHFRKDDSFWQVVNPGQSKP